MRPGARRGGAERGARAGRRFVAAAVVLVLLAATGAAANGGLLLPTTSGDEVLTLLLLGSDEGPPRSSSPLSGRADAFQLLFVARDRQHATFVSIPRDSWVDVAGHGTSRINDCLVSGPEGCVATAEQAFGVEVDGYLLSSMRGFAHAVQAFGGLTVEVPTPLYDGGADIPDSGEQHLRGSQALTYARDRKNRSGGDFDRSEAQAEILALAHAEVVRDGGLDRVLEGVSLIRRHTATDLTGTELVRYGFEAMRLPPENVDRVRVPGSPGMAGSASVVFLADGAYPLIRDAAEDGRIGTD